MAPVHAGLMGQDALFLLDEVHLSRPFARTLRQIKDRWHNSAWGTDASTRWQVVEMSATPGAMDEHVLRLTSADRDHPVLKRRLEASKRAHLEVVPVRTRDDDATKRVAIAKAAALRALSILEKTSAKTVAIVLNRVDSARSAWATLSSHGEIDACLITGRMRPLDRDRLYEGLAARVAAGRTRDPNSKPLVVVATQTIEAGADLDFDALVTECASMDALRQRFGRVDRRGELARTESWVLIRSDQQGSSTDDPVYGEALSKTWNHLKAQEESLDFGIAHLAEPDAGAGVFREPPPSPTILPEYLDAWSSTSQVPEPDPEIALWLHGVVTSIPEVQVVWRTEIAEEEFEAHVPLENLESALGACPPSPAEALPLPLHAVRAWLTRAPEPPIADAGPSLSTEEPRKQHAVRAVVWTGNECRLTSKASDLRPGETVIVPVERGGLRGGNWDPDASDPVSDLGDEAQTAYGRTATWRLSERLLQQKYPGLRPPTIPTNDETVTPASTIRGWLGDRAAELDEGQQAWVEDFRSVGGRSARWELLPNGTFVLHPRRPPKTKATRDVGPASTESAGYDSGSMSGTAVTLRKHSNDVRRWAQSFVENLDLPQPLAHDVVLAAWFHDLGKADPRFQVMLCGGSAIQLSLYKEPLAKGVVPATDRARAKEARLRAGYPAGERHELLSVHLIEQTPGALSEAHDPELVLHLVGSHHGWCRPFAPPVDTADDIMVQVELEGHRFEAGSRHGMARLDSDVAERFWRLTERYGWWVLAWLEAIVRLSDHRASEEVQRWKH